MDDESFDRALIAEAFELIADKGWRGASVAEAARRAALPLDRARGRFPDMMRVLFRFGRLADQAALADLDGTGTTRDALFGMIMRRIDLLQSHRAGMRALLRGLPADPLLAATLAGTTLRSMAWLLEAAGLSSRGLDGMVRAQGLTAVWLWTVREWERDDSPDLSGTMAALDTALSRAEQAAGWFGGRRTPPPSDEDLADVAEEVSAADAMAASPEAMLVDEELPPTASFVPPETPASPPV